MVRPMEAPTTDITVERNTHVDPVEAAYARQQIHSLARWMGLAIEAAHVELTRTPLVSAMNGEHTAFASCSLRAGGHSVTSLAEGRTMFEAIDLLTVRLRRMIEASAQ